MFAVHLWLSDAIWPEASFNLLLSVKAQSSAKNRSVDYWNMNWKSSAKNSITIK